ncbi:hypothetical protein [uncultured Aquimarina sp.]|uniref:hypothetical protein n=1 Tax=uncultured Aquimarina sp. TaxID=575652 RepID=UPI002624EEF3|nr:hypothetical protein [uncultured Aquimarina sp.]
MRKSLFFLGVLISNICTFGQVTNSFPDTGKVGIGTTNPDTTLDVRGTVKGNIMHNGGYFTMYPYSSGYDDGSYVKSFYDGNRKQVIFWNSDANTDYTRLQTGGLTISSKNPNSSVHGFANKIELTGNSNGAMVFKPGDVKELMFGMHDNGHFYWGTGQSATKPNFYSMILDGNTGDLTVYNWIRPKGNAGIFFQDHGGGFNMSDDSWIRTYGNKNFYHNTGVMRTDGSLHVGPSGNRFIVNTEGKVGIRTSAPEETLHVKGTTTIDGDIGEITEGAHWHTGKHTLELQNRDAGDVVLSFHRAGHTNAAIKHPTTGGIAFSATGGFDQTHMYLKTNGYLGIGTTTPDAKLAVNGNIHTKEVKVDLIGWADYVFKKDYNLPTLQQVEDHINTKGHLINIPSAAEVAENGIQLGEMNAKLLEKIEELTLYTIAQEKKLKEQQKKLIKQEDEISVLKSQSSRINKLEEKLNTLLKTK